MHDQLIDQAEAAGFTAAAKQARDLIHRKNKLAYAYEHFRYVTKQQFDAFNAELHKKTSRHEGAYPNLYECFDTLAIVPVEQYGEIPPPEVLTKIQEVRDAGVFDVLEVAKIESTRVYRDPIVFGRIVGCDDRFFICQWDVDVNINDILGEHGG